MDYPNDNEYYVDMDDYPELNELMYILDSETPIATEVTGRLTELANKVIAGGDGVRTEMLSLGAYTAVTRAWVVCYFNAISENGKPPADAKRCRDAVIRTMYALTAGQPNIIDDVGWQIIVRATEKAVPETTHIYLLKLIRNICIKSEENRDHITWNLDLLKPLIAFVTTKPTSRPSIQLLREWCMTMKALILNDDIRVTYNRAAERKCMILKSGILPSLAGHVHHHEYSHNEGVLNALVIFLGSMVVNNDICLLLDSGNILSGIHNIFKTHFHNKTLVRNTLSLLRSLNAHQFTRDKTSSFALMKWIVEVLTHYNKDPDMVDGALSCCSYMTIRNACQIAQFISKNGLQLILQLMTEYKQNTTILKAACIILRNVAEGGGNEGRDRIREAGYMPFLNHLMANVPELKEFYILPLTKELGTGPGLPAILASHGYDKRNFPEAVRYEPQLGRKSVILDETEDEFLP